jgi:hypothetical protein
VLKKKMMRRWEFKHSREIGGKVGPRLSAIIFFHSYQSQPLDFDRTVQIKKSLNNFIY